jgi:hypothetical protein
MMHMLHDSELVALSVNRAIKFARLEFRLESGEGIFAEMYGLRAFRSEDFVLQNVVSRILYSSRGDLEPKRLMYWLDWATRLSDAGSWLPDKKREDWLCACMSGDLELIVIEPSVGAQVVAICDEVALRK